MQITHTFRKKSIEKIDKKTVKTIKSVFKENSLDLLEGCPVTTKIDTECYNESVIVESVKGLIAAVGGGYFGEYLFELSYHIEDNIIHKLSPKLTINGKKFNKKCELTEELHVIFENSNSINETIEKLTIFIKSVEDKHTPLFSIRHNFFNESGQFELTFYNGKIGMDLDGINGYAYTQNEKVVYFELNFHNEWISEDKFRNIIKYINFSLQPSFFWEKAGDNYKINGTMQVSADIVQEMFLDFLKTNPDKKKNG